MYCAHVAAWIIVGALRTTDKVTALNMSDVNATETYTVSFTVHNFVKCAWQRTAYVNARWTKLRLYQCICD